MEDELRKSGIEVIGSVPWGTHFCQFYRTKQDLIDILIPYFKAGLESNEFCMWITAEPLKTTRARDALRRAIPDLDHYIQKGQIEIIPHTKWYLLGGKFNDDRVLNGWISKLEQALDKGYSGLRLTGNTFWLERNGWQAFTEYEAKVNDIIGKYRMLAICTYYLDKCDGAAVVDVVKNHQFALIKEEGKWDIIQSTVYRQAKEALLESEEKYRSLFKNMTEGFSLYEIICDDNGKPYTFRYLAVNPAFEHQTGLKALDIVGRTTLELFPQAEPVWFERFRKVALIGEPAHFEAWFGPLGQCFEVSAFQTEPSHFAVLFFDITERKKGEEELFRLNRALRALSDCNQAIVRSTDEQTLFTDVCRIMCDVVGYCMAWVGSVEHDEAKSIQPIAWYGADNGYLAKGSITWADTDRGRGPTGIAARTGKTEFCQDFVTETRAAPWREAALARGFRSSIALPLFDNDGNVFSVLSLYAAVPNGFTPVEVQLLEELTGDLAFGVSALRDRVKREQAEEKLRETRDYLNNLLDYANAPIIVWDPNYRITRFNHAFERLTGRTSDEVIGKELDILFPEDKKVESMAYIDQASSGEHWEVVEIPILNKDGSVHTVLWNSATLYDKDGKTPIATIAQGQDITERRRIEEAMQFERDRLINILNSMQDGVCIVNRDYDLEYVNPSMKSQYGNIDAQKCYQYLYSRDEFCPWCSINEVIDGKTVQREAELSSIGRTYEITETPLHNVDGSTSKLAMYHDVTERKKIEQMKDEFVGMVSHELKTPITVIMGAIYTAMSEGISKEEAKLLLEDAASSAGSLADIVDNLLELSRVQANRLMIRKESVDIDQVAHDVAEKLKGRSETHRLLIEMPADLPKVSADRVRVERVLYNLMENAIKYSPNGGSITVSARQRDDYLIVSVKDPGMGIAQADQARLFKPFERLESTKSVSGSGLGLNVCRRLVEAHGGQMWVESEPGHGATFFFSLPLG
jgi:PAS domain S-box-containing protein